jgi:phage protein D
VAALPLSNATSAYASPRLLITANGQIVPGVLAAEVVSNNYYAADRFNASIALGADPEMSAAYWSNESNIQVDIQFSVDNGMSYSSLLYGAVDCVSIELTSGLVHVTGRDLTASLIAARTQETFANHTASEIAALLAERHNLIPQISQTTTIVGRYYQSQHDRVTLDEFSRATTEWDLLVFLARQEGFDVYIQGQALHFQPSSTPNDVALSLQPTDVIDLRLERSLILAQDVEVIVKSWNSRLNDVCTERAATTAGGSTASSRRQSYVYVRPNLTSDDALRLANQRLAEIARHQRTIEIRMPGELTLTPRSLIALDGTGTEFDQTYYVDVIERRLDTSRGFTQFVRARTTSLEATAT